MGTPPMWLACSLSQSIYGSILRYKHKITLDGDHERFFVETKLSADLVGIAILILNLSLIFAGIVLPCSVFLNWDPLYLLTNHVAGLGGPESWPICSICTGETRNFKVICEYFDCCDANI